MVRPRLKVFCFNKDNLTGNSEKTDRKGGKTISKCGQEWTLPAQLGQLKTGQGGSLRILLWCPENPPRLRDRNIIVLRK